MAANSLKASDIRSPWVRLAFLLLSALWAGGAWLILLEGGFYRTVKYSRESTFVGGAGGVFLALTFLVLAAAAGCILLRSFQAPRLTIVALILVIFGPPVWFLLQA